MKKIIIIIGILGLLVSCSNSPEIVTEKFLKNISVGNIDKVKDYTTSSFGKQLDFMSKITSIPVNPDFEYRFVSDSIEGKKAWVRFEDLSSKRDGIMVVKLIKDDGDWKVYKMHK